MKRHILARFRPEVVHKDLLVVRVKQIFEDLQGLPGVKSITVEPSGEDAFDFHIMIELSRDIYATVQDAEPYHVFQAEFGPLLENIVTFDDEY